MRHLIAQGIKQKHLIKSRKGFVSIQPSRHLRGVELIGQGVGHMRISESERALRDGSFAGEGLRHKTHKKAIKPLKFRI